MLFRTVFTIGYNTHLHIKSLAKTLHWFAWEPLKKPEGEVFLKGHSYLSIIAACREAIRVCLNWLVSTPKLWMSHPILICVALVSAVTLLGLQQNPNLVVFDAFLVRQSWNNLSYTSVEKKSSHTSHYATALSSSSHIKCLKCKCNSRKTNTKVQSVWNLF